MASFQSPSILKDSRVTLSSKKLTQPLQVRFSDPIANINVVSIIKKYVETQNDFSLGQLLALKEQFDTCDDVLLNVLQQVNKSISILSPKAEEFVIMILSTPWTTRSPAVIEEFISFVQTLVSAHSYYCRTVVGALVMNFTLDPDSEIAANHVYEVLKGILDLIPLSHNIILDILNENFPNLGTETNSQVNYVKNLIQFSEYSTISRPYVLKIIVGRLVKLDCRVPREDLLKSSIRPMDCDDENENEKGSISSIDVQTLDGLMGIMFQLCLNKCFKCDWPTHRSFYHDMYSTFESLILPAVGIHHVHFLMFYICSTKPALYEAFIERLWNMFQDPSSPLNIRKSSADYLASFLGKASFVPMKVVTFCLERVCQWIHAYLDRQLKGEGAALFKIRAHSAFYAACHIPFYVVAARHHDFLGNKKLLTSLQTLDLNRIVSSPLNPLRHCHSTTVRQFAESASHLQIVFCHTIMIRNQRLCVPEATTDSLVLDTEYPFEKYLLPGTVEYVSNLLIDKPIGRDDSLYDSDQVMEELLSESPRVSGGFMHHFLA